MTDETKGADGLPCPHGRPSWEMCPHCRGFAFGPAPAPRAETHASAEPAYDMRIHRNPDARAWARFYAETCAKLGKECDEEWMVGWFANAMMAMHDHDALAPAAPAASQEGALTAPEPEPGVAEMLAVYGGDPFGYVPAEIATLRAALRASEAEAERLRGEAAAAERVGRALVASAETERDQAVGQARRERDAALKERDRLLDPVVRAKMRELPPPIILQGDALSLARLRERIKGLAERWARERRETATGCWHDCGERHAREVRVVLGGEEGGRHG